MGAAPKNDALLAASTLMIMAQFAVVARRVQQMSQLQRLLGLGMNNFFRFAQQGHRLV